MHAADNLAWIRYPSEVQFPWTGTYTVYTVQQFSRAEIVLHASDLLHQPEAEVVARSPAREAVAEPADQASAAHLDINCKSCRFLARWLLAHLARLPPRDGPAILKYINSHAYAWCVL